MKTNISPRFTLSEEQKAFYRREGYLIVRKLFDASDVAAIRDRFDEIGRGPAITHYWQPDRSPEAANDPLKVFPRVMMPHRYDDLSKQYLLDGRIRGALRDLLGEEPIAAQSMFYFKPPGARGQAMHQDNFYLKVKPTSCIAAWVAIDPAIPKNGGMFVVPGTHDLEIVCPDVADTTESFTSHLVKAPKGKKAVPAEMEPGDCLFFNGSVIHGSGPNRHESLWRRSFICHYLPASSSHIAKHYHPLLDFDGNDVAYATSDDGGPCGDEVDVGKYVSYGKWH
jgi:ectoine hydroxylase-related dioxygenase (phytanoyl-CoA dioxygenase family)